MSEPNADRNPGRDWVWLARVRRAQGRNGEVFADILTDFPEKFAERSRLWLVAEPRSPQGAAAPMEVRLVGHWRHKGGIVLHFAQSTNISEAEALAGLYVAIPREQRAALAEDEVYIGDLIGCLVIDVAAHEQSGEPCKTVGAIGDVVRECGAAPMLVVQGARGEVLIPFAKSYLRKLDLDARRLEMALPAGLADLNA